MSTDPRYISYCFDVMLNLSELYNDTRMMMNIELTVDDDKEGDLVFRGKGDSSFFGSVDSKQKVKNMCTSKSMLVGITSKPLLATQKIFWY